MEHKIYILMVLNIQPSVSTYSVCNMKMKQLPPHRLHKREGALELYVGSTTSSPMSRGAWGGTLGIPERTLLLGPLNRRAGTTRCFCIAKIYESVTLYQFSSVAQSCPTLCNPMDCSTPGLPVHHQSLEACSLTSIKSVMLSNHFILCRPHSPPVFNLSQHQGLFQWVCSSHQVAKVLEFQLQYQSFQWIFRTDFL